MPLDMWSFGVTLFLMCTGENLFPTDNYDNIDKMQQQKYLAVFPDDFKKKQLEKCPNHWARNLLFQLLSLDPRRRPSAAECLRHPFFEGVHPDIASIYRMPGENSKYDVCICYCSKAFKKMHRKRIVEKEIKAKKEKGPILPGLEGDEDEEEEEEFSDEDDDTKYFEISNQEEEVQVRAYVRLIFKG